MPVTNSNTMTEDLFALHAEIATMHFLKEADNPYFKSKYLDYPSLIATVKPVLHKHGFVWFTVPGFISGEPTLKYILMYKTGEIAVEGSMLLSAKGVTPQDQGGAITYARRYSLTAVLDIAADEDDDGNKATDAVKGVTKAKEDVAKPITDQTKGNVYMLLKKLEMDLETFQKSIGTQVDSLTELDGNAVVRKLMTELEKRAVVK